MFLWTRPECLWVWNMQHLDCSLEASECKIASAVFVNKMNIEHDRNFTCLGCYMLWDCDLLLMWDSGQIVTCVQHWQIIKRITKRMNTILDLWQSHYEWKNCTLSKPERGNRGSRRNKILDTCYRIRQLQVIMQYTAGLWNNWETGIRDRN